MKKHLLPYFIQNKSWMEFWKNAQTDSRHAYHYFENELCSTYVFEYPYMFGRKFWYISKGFIINEEAFVHIQHEYSKEVLQKKCVELIQEIYQDAQKKSIAFIKCDFDDTLSNELDIQNIQPYIQLIRTYFPFLSVVQSSKHIQYLTSSYNYIAWDSLHVDIDDTLHQFYLKTTPLFWSHCNEKVRRYTRKALSLADLSSPSQFWFITQEKTENSFEQFYSIHTQTSQRQKFPTQPYSYLKALYFAPFTHSIIIRDGQGNPHCVWLGIELNGQMTYLLGGNTETSFKKWAQYLVHVVALRLCYHHNISYYDMGGYDAAQGYGQFKDGYKGHLRQFVGVLDIILDKNYYRAVNIMRRIKSLFKR